MQRVFFFFFFDFFKLWEVFGNNESNRVKLTENDLYQFYREIECLNYASTLFAVIIIIDAKPKIYLWILLHGKQGRN